MPRNYEDRLSRMREQRHLEKSARELFKAASTPAFATPIPLVESYLQRANTPTIQYALGAMQSIEPDYTRISLNEAERVVAHLVGKVPAEFELQGSVPLDIHVRTSSDIDVLTLHTGFFTFDATGPKRYQGSAEIDPKAKIWELRSSCESILESAFPAVKVDKSGAKSIALTGGSLQRKVDIVPSHWHDTATYQSSALKRDRAVEVFDRKADRFVSNQPFLYMEKIEEKHRRTLTGAKKVIRLLKVLRRDCGKKVALSSYEISSLVWNMPDQSLIKSQDAQLALVGNVLHTVCYLVDNPSEADRLRTPDDSRKIFETKDQFESLKVIRQELVELSKDIAEELSGVPPGNLQKAYDQLIGSRIR